MGVVMTDFSDFLRATHHTGADNRFGANTISMRMAVSLVHSLANRMAYDASMMKRGDISEATLVDFAAELENAATELRRASEMNAIKFQQAAE